MKKLVTLFLVLSVITGCHAQATVNSPEQQDQAVWEPAREEGETSSEEVTQETVRERNGDDGWPVEEEAAPPAPKAKQQPQPQRPQPQVFQTPGSGPGGVALVEGEYEVERYGPMVKSWVPGWMLHVYNHTKRYAHVTPYGAVPFTRKNAQAHLFVRKIDADSGMPVILLRPGASAYWVVDQNLCPPNGEPCDVTAQIAFYATTGPTSKRLGRTITHTRTFTGMDPKGQYIRVR